jgi:FlaA1/EpsC-like NDP-sugar epimerase
MVEVDSPPGSSDVRPWWAAFLRRPMHFVLDGVLLLVVFVFAYALRFEFRIPRLWVDRALIQAPVFVGLQIAALAASGVYAYIWRYVGLAELRGFARGILISLVPIAALRLLRVAPLDAPTSVIIIDGILALVGVVGLRVLRRLVYERFEKSAGAPRRKKAILLLGAGRAGVLAAREIGARGDGELEIKGFVDDDDLKVGSVIHGVKVLGTTRDLARLVHQHHIDHIVITIARATRPEMRRILDVCESVPVKARVIPGLLELLQGNVAVSQIRNVEIEDLLGREPVQLDMELVGRFLTQRVVVVTGAGGSIGSELCRQIARFGPRRLLLVEQAEGALFDIDRELRAKFSAVDIVPVIADVTDHERIDRLFARERPDVVVHAAAHKHVPMMEKNPGEAVKNNVVGTRTVAEAAGRHAVAAFVLISTDKAVNPTSVMGATKRLAELSIQALQRRFSETRFVAVRFGNVLGSAGSVIPIFREQILKGGPVTVTHPDMIRYFMTIPEAAQLVVQAGAMGQGGEIFVLDMGEPVRVLDLAKDMIRLSGLRPGEDIEIAFSGMRPGEKLFEELGTNNEAVEKTHHPKIFIGRIRGTDVDILDAGVARLLQAAADDDGARVRAELKILIPEALIGADIPGVTGPSASTLPSSALPSPALPASR